MVEDAVAADVAVAAGLDEARRLRPAVPLPLVAEVAAEEG